MPLVFCPECKAAVSDAAIACPHCGYPRPGEAQKRSMKITELLDPYEGPLDLTVGQLIKTRVHIDEELVAFGRKKIQCNSVIVLGWWSQTTKNLEWAQNEWTTSWLWVKSDTKKLKLTVPGRDDFEQITEKLWEFVGLRMLADIAQKLDENCDVSLCGLRLNGEGVELGKLVGKSAIVPWEKIETFNWDGKLRVSSVDDKWRNKSMSYRSTDNLPILHNLLVNIRRQKLIKNQSWLQAVGI